jgi:putative PIN family toxin of toxin-antitoxin system
VLVVFDPTTFVSALITPTGLARRVLQAGIEGRFEFAVYPILLGELEEVAKRPKITGMVQPETAERFLADVRGGAQLQEDPEVASVSRDPKDDYLVALGIPVRVGHLVTGDKDLLALDDPPVHVTSLRAFAELLEREEAS